LKTIEKIKPKQYKCTGCGWVRMIETNHYCEIYPFCSECNDRTVWKCIEEIPEGFDVPVPWKMVKLGTACEILK
jgi:hypothetical protein